MFNFNPTFNSRSFLFVTIIILFCMQSQDWDRLSYKQWRTDHFCYDGNINGWNQTQHDGEEQWWPCIITLLVVRRSGNLKCDHSWPAQKKKVSGNWSNENINRVVPVICRFQTPHGRTLIHLKQQHRTMPTAEPQGIWCAHQQTIKYMKRVQPIQHEWDMMLSTRDIIRQQIFFSGHWLRHNYHKYKYIICKQLSNHPKRKAHNINFSTI